MALYRTQDADILKSHLPVRGDFHLDLLLTVQEDVVQEVIIPAIGQDMYDEVDFQYNNGGLSVANTVLVEKLQHAIAPLLLLYAKDLLNPQMTSNGIMISVDDHTKPAFEWQVARMEEQINRLSFNRVELVLQYMEANKVQYATWTGSDAYDDSKSLFINSAREYTLHYAHLRNSRQLYNLLKSAMTQVEEAEMVAILGSALQEEIKGQIKNNSLTAANRAILPDIQRAVAYLAMWQLLHEMSLSISLTHQGLMLNYKSERGNINAADTASDTRLATLLSFAENKGKGYLAKLKAYLDMNYSSYPLYPYEEDGMADFENDVDSPIFMI